MADVKDILEKYGRKLEGEVKMNSNWATSNSSAFGSESREFSRFKEETMPKYSRYEKWCHSFGNVVKLKLTQKDEDGIAGILGEAHLDTTPGQVVGLAMMAGFGTFLVGLVLSVALFLFTDSFPGLFLFLAFVTAGFLFYYFYTMPKRLANQWRLKASSQMIPCILYTVVYMKHTSNLERAVAFASQHMEPPLSFDLKKVFWDIETGRFSTIKESLDNYLEGWRKYAPEFVESFSLIESSLYEPSDDRRIEVLERSLQVILDGVYDKMLKFTHSVKSPLTNLYMLGIVLPTLGLALLPLASTLLGGMIKWYHVFILFNLLVPFFVFYMTNQIMMRRPGGYGEASVLELNPLYQDYKSKRHYLKAACISVPLMITGLIPFILRIPGFANLLGIKSDYSFAEIGLGFLGNLKLFDFIDIGKGAVVGPMGPFALLLSLFIPLSIFLFFSIAYKSKTKEIILSRENTKILEKEFNNSLFKLGNRIGDGTPAEIAFGKVAESSQGMVTEDFFKIVNSNIHSLGMGVEKAIFDPGRGAIVYYPSTLISTSMHILIESIKKGLKVAARALMSISDYVKNINKISDRLNDLLADVVSDMKSNMTFLAPLLAGIVVGLGSMITLILSKLTALIAGIQTGEAASFTNVANVTQLFKIEGMIPPYFLQIIIGLYIIEIIFILTKTLVTVDAGQDELKETYEISRNLLQGGLLYLITALVSILALSALAVISLSGLGY